MSRTGADRNLLFGILAVQMDFVAADQLIAAMNAWVLDKQKPLGGHLVDAGALAAETHALIQALVDKHVEQHGGRVEQSLAALSSVEPLRNDLARIADADVQQTLARVGSTIQGDRHATIAVPQPRAMPAGQRFRILRPHASGGLGKVSVARDSELNREVALKELHDRHADNPDSRARFLQEAEITGGLEHPGVVPIYGLGQYADGRPFYAMRFIRGDSLAQAIERFHREADDNWSNAADVLQLRRLLNRLIDVCNAMDYAHSRGVLHRDLKPGNIMLGQYGETLVVDWGLAKPLGHAAEKPVESDAATIPPSHEGTLNPQSGSGSAPTQMGSAIGTPAYMSPEQAAGRLDQLGPASDVFSLGATLYVLLTGKSPQEEDDLGVVIQRVQRGEFPPPRSIKPAAPRALEAICLKAMALRPEDRYPSPRKLAEDVEAWLADEPVTALLEPWTARAGRWVKKHRTLVSSAAALLVASLVGLIIGNFSLSAANQRERDAKDAALAAQRVAETAQAEAERQIARNEELLALARKSLERYETLSKSELLGQYGFETLRENLLEAALEFYETLGKQAGESEAARSDRAEALYRRASTLWQLGRMAETRATFDQALDVFRKLSQDYPDNLRYRRGIATIQSAIGEMLIDAQELNAAAAPMAEARERFEAIRSAQPGEVVDSTRLAYANSLEGDRLRQLGKTADGEAAFRRAVELLRQAHVPTLSADDSHDVRFRLGRALNQLARHEIYSLWHFADARTTLAEAEEVMGGLFKEDPTVGDVGHSLAQIYRSLGYVNEREQRFDDARAAYQRALETIVEVEKHRPNVPHFRQETADILSSLATLRPNFGGPAVTPESIAQLEEAVAISQQLAENFPQQVERRVTLAQEQQALGNWYQLAERMDDARRLLDAAAASLALGSSQMREGVISVDQLEAMASVQFSIAEQLIDVDRVAEAHAMLNDAESTLDKLVTMAPNLGETHLSLAQVYISRANCFQGEGRYIDAILELNRVVAGLEKAGEFGKADWMTATMKTLATVSGTLRFAIMAAIRTDGLTTLADEGKFELVRDQAVRLPELTHEPSDHYAAARVLAYAATAASTSTDLTDDQKPATVESLAGEAVKQLTSAWQQGYLKRSSGFGAMLRGAPTLKTLQRDEQFDVLRAREDFAALLKRIETETPPRHEAASADEQPAPTP